MAYIRKQVFIKIIQGLKYSDTIDGVALIFWVMIFQNLHPPLS